jgi:hypothetical protein
MLEVYLIGGHDEGEATDTEDGAQCEENVRQQLWIRHPRWSPVYCNIMHLTTFCLLLKVKDKHSTKLSII